MKNTPNLENREYTKYKADILKVDNVYNGSKSSATYLQTFVNEAVESFEYRLENLTMLNYVRKSIQSTKDFIFRKPLTIEGTIDENEIKSLNVLAIDLTIQLLKDGFCYIVIDSERYDESVQTRADEISQGLEPYMYVVNRLSVPNWSYNEDGSYSHVTINEAYDVKKGYITETYEQQRVFNDDGIVEIWRDGELYETIETNLNYVPVVKVGFEDVPYLLDLSKLSINHMNRRSELNRYLRIASTPVPVFYGVEDTGSEIVIGVDVATTFRSKDEGGFEWVELSGTSVDLLQEDLKRLEFMMSEFVISLISGEGDQNKTATQIQVEAASDESLLLNIAIIVENGMNEALALLAEQTGKAVVVDVNKDYTTAIMTSDQVASNLTLFREGVISLDTLIDILKKGEVLEESLNVDEEIKKIMVPANDA